MTQYKCLLPLALFYMTIKLATVLLIYKIVAIGPISISASTLVITLWFLTGDDIAEIYGYEISKQIIWAVLICQFMFAIICTISINLPSATNFVYQDSYDRIFGNLPRVVFSSSLAIMCGSFVNAYLISKWKVLLHGKLFWMRSLGASFFGLAIFVVIALPMEFIGVLPIKTILELMFVSFATKIVIIPILVIPSSLLVAMIKKIEKVDVYDYDLEFNPFKIRLSKSSNDRLLNPI